MNFNCGCENFSKCFDARMKKITDTFNGFDICGNCPEPSPVLHRGEKMRYLSNRLKSFENWKNTEIIKPTELASCGFYYLGEGDRVKCAFCNLGLENFDKGDVARDEHMKWKNDCLLINKGITDNIPYLTDNERILRNLSINGIFFMTFNICRCGICGINFEKGDKTWSDIHRDHKLWSPACPLIEYLEKQKIDEKINNENISYKKIKMNCVQNIFTDMMHIKEILTALCIKNDFREDIEARKWLVRFDNWYQILKNKFLFSVEDFGSEEEWSVESLMDVLTIIDVFKRLSECEGREAFKYYKNLEIILDHVNKKIVKNK